MRGWTKLWNISMGLTLIYFYLKALNNHILSSDKLFGLMLSEPFKLDLEDYNKILHEKQLLKSDKSNDFISIMW